MTSKKTSETALPKNGKGAAIASPGHMSITGNKAGSKMKISDLRSGSSKR